MTLRYALSVSMVPHGVYFYCNAQAMPECCVRSHGLSFLAVFSAGPRFYMGGSIILHPMLLLICCMILCAARYQYTHMYCIGSAGGSTGVCNTTVASQ